LKNGLLPLSKCTLGSRGYVFLIDTDGSRRSRVNEEKNNLWSQEYATSFPCEKTVQNLNWVTDWIIPCQVVRCSQSGPLLYCYFPAELWIKKQTNYSLLTQTLIHLIKRGNFTIAVRLTKNM